MNLSATNIDIGLNKWSGRLGWVLLGWFACSWYYGTLDLTEAKKEVPVLASEAGCEHWRASQEAKLALAPTVVDPSQLPKACPHPALPK